MWTRSWRTRLNSCSPTRASLRSCWTRTALHHCLSVRPMFYDCHTPNHKANRYKTKAGTRRSGNSLEFCAKHETYWRLAVGKYQQILTLCSETDHRKGICSQSGSFSVSTTAKITALRGGRVCSTRSDKRDQSRKDYAMVVRKHLVVYTTRGGPT